MKKHLTILLLACAALLAHAQSSFAQSQFAQLTPEQMGGTFYAYPAPKKVEVVPAPQGYSLAYLSHFGRHGSRYMTNDARYTWVLDHFADEQNLTSYGRKVKRQLEKVYADAKGQGGQLTTLGVKQHEGIARRMVQRFPGFLESAVAIDAHSTVVRRCRKSMEAFMSALEEELERGERNRRSAPTGKAKEEREKREHTTPLSLERGWGRGRFFLTTDSSEMVWMNHEPEEQRLLEKEQVSVPTVSTDRLFGKLFRNPSIVEDKDNLFNELYAIASDLQDVEGLGVSLYHLFTREELQTSYEIACRKMWHHHGAGPASRGIPAQSAANLWANIVSEADSALASGEPRATLRFGHDSGLYKLLVLLTSETATTYNGFNLHEIVPMAANLQMAFYVEELKVKRETRKEEAVLVAFWLNEQPMRLTAVEAELTTGGQTYYSWEKVTRAFAHYIETQRWKDRTAAVNTMVGTDYAVTKTAGLYGKGSEEHGQTLPAVLAPHGMNFWTPQTRDTEKKCIAPYYYPDSLLQGFRASHWIVGGCTQDYGSFTIMPLMGQVRLDAEARATRFSHNDEVAHPYYYGVRLPDEHLTAELTASTNADGTGSRAALFRFTPTESGTMHIVIDSNNDYGEGFVAIDTVHNAIVGHNPVHRIYQGWGESAGFSGHFVVQFQRPIELSHTQDSVAYVSFEVKKGEEILVRAATSFTSLDGAWLNLQAEMPTWDFLSARLALDSVWQQQLARIDVEDDDQAKVNQFYGALYRASFLPHVLSDVDGKHPDFGQCEVSSVKGEGGNSTLHTSHFILHPSPSTLHPSPSTLKSPYYDDFSMWDIYRAQLPLLTITDSARVSDMAASLVTKYEQGGWMPIFPCWNSYTAAMIGDHAAAALADAWVKGIRGFDVDKAYEGVRKNAFESPATLEEYKNGMGRRALKSYLKYGYIPLEDNVSEAFHIQEQVSRTLEYAYDDFCAAQLAKATGHDDDYRELMRRSGNWKNVFNPKLGWMDARHQPTDRAFKKNPQAKGGFLGNTDLTSRVPFITEGAVVHYSFYVPHDVPGLIEAMGGREKFIEKLDTLFGQCEVNSVKCEGSNSTLHTSHSTLNNSSFYWHGNEPCHHIAYLYALAGQPERTRQLVSYIMDTEYMDVPGGLSGNDDAGQMSAWYVFSAMGFYPVCPGKAEYVLGQPMFKKVRIGRLTIENKKANQTTENNVGGTISQIRYNGAPYTQPIITHDMLTREGTLTFE